MLKEASTTINLKDFGMALRREREGIGDSIAKFAKSTAGISKQDVRDFEAGIKAPDKLTLKKIVHCFPILSAFEGALRAGNYETEERPSEVRIKAAAPVKWEKPKAEPTRLPPPPRKALALVPRPQAAAKPKLEIVRQHEQPVTLTAPLAPTLTKALRKTRAEMLTELTRTVTKRLGSLTSEHYDFTCKNDGKFLTVKLQLTEGEETVDSGCYLTVGSRGDGLGVFARTIATGNFDARSEGVLELLALGKVLHDAVKDRVFE